VRIRRNLHHPSPALNLNPFPPRAPARSEIGDKTFFVAALFAMKASRAVSFIGSIGALGVMTVIAVLIGQIFHSIPEIPALNGIKAQPFAIHTAVHIHFLACH
jgi:putative Ca2+/H+ antiporter (TMEM165/GDT1 family)